MSEQQAIPMTNDKEACAIDVLDGNAFAVGSVLSCRRCFVKTLEKTLVVKDPDGFIQIQDGATCQRLSTIGDAYHS